MSIAMELPSLAFLCGTVILAALSYFLFASARKVKDLKDKYVLVTGCDSGFGQDTAKKLDELGLHVFAACYTSQGEEHLTQACTSRLTTLRLDVTDSASVKQAFEFVKKELPPDTGLWGIVNNAGVMIFGPVEWLSLADFRAAADVNLWGMLDVSKTFLPLLKLARGRIVNVVSMSGRVTVPQASTYAVSKYGAEALSNGLRLELGCWGIKVSIIEPGFFRTNMTSDEATLGRIQAAWDKLSPEMKEEYGEKYLEQSKANWKSMVGLATSKTDEVVNSITHALTSTRPKIRYVVGYDALWLWRQITMLPDTVHDFVFSLVAGPPIPCSAQSH